MSSKQKVEFKETEIGLISEDWTIKKLEEVCSKEKGTIISGPFGSNIGSRFFVKTGIPVIRGNNLSVNFAKFIDDGFVFITPEKANELHTWAEVDDLIFTAAGTLGQVGIIPKNRKFDKYIISNKQLRARLDKNLIIPLFAYYWFKTKQMIRYIEMRSTGSTIPLINLSVLKSLPLPYPEFREQQRITKILSEIDSKIELNQQMNKTLEAMGKAIFKHWFIDFEFLNEEGKPYKSSGGEMVYNEELEKEIPRGWEVSDISHEFNLIMGQSPPGKSYNELGEGAVFFQGRADFGFRFPTPRVFCTKPTRFAKKGDTLVSVRAPVGDVNIASQDCCIGRGLSAIRHKSSHTSYTFYAMSNLKTTFDNFEAEGTVFGSMSKVDFEKIKILCPPKKLIDSFEKCVTSIDKKIENNTLQMQALTSIRASLLPKLMSGKIRVPIEAK